VVNRTLKTLLVVASGLFVLVACPPVAGTVTPEPDVTVVVASRPDAGRVVVPVVDAGAPEEAWDASGEPCPPEAFGTLRLDDGGVEEVPDGSIQFGLCVALRTVSGQAVLNNAPAASFKLQFKAGGFGSEFERTLPANGLYDVKVMKGNYDLFYYQPGGVFLTHEGPVEQGRLDLRSNQSRRLEAQSYTLAGTALYGGVPFVPSRTPNDVGFEVFGPSRVGAPTSQRVSTVSQTGAYELKLLKGAFSVYLNAPPSALYGTELRRFMVTSATLEFDRDQALDLDIPSATLEGELLLDGQPMPDRRAGADFSLEYTVPGQREPTVVSHHEGGYRTISAMVPKGEYGVTLKLVASPDLHYPSEVSFIPLAGALDLRRDARLSARADTISIEGSLSIDGQPVRPNPTYNWNMYMYGFAGMVATQSYLTYEVPLQSSAFRLQAFAGNYYTVLQLSDELAPNLVDGWFVVDRYFQVQAPTRLPIDIKTGTYSGKLLIDGKPPPAGVPVGSFIFANRDPLYRNSFFRRRAVVSEDGQFQARLPVGIYDVYFVIDRDVYPEYAAGFRLVATQLFISQNEVSNDDLDYQTVLVTGPLRVGGQVVQKVIGGPEVGLRLERGDGRTYEWSFNGGSPNYRLRVPPGQYLVEFLINPNGIDGVAWGNAMLGGPPLRAFDVNGPPPGAK